VSDQRDAETCLWHSRQTSMPPVGFKLTITACDQLQSGINANNLSTVILVLQPVGPGIKWLIVATEDKNWNETCIRKAMKCHHLSLILALYCVVGVPDIRHQRLDHWKIICHWKKLDFCCSLQSLGISKWSLCSKRLVCTAVDPWRWRHFSPWNTSNHWTYDVMTEGLNHNAQMTLP